MIKPGDYNLLVVKRFTDNGAYLSEKDEADEVLLPKRYVDEHLEEGAFVEAFIYHDSEDRLVATTEEPALTIGEFARLQVVATTTFGAFLDWGLPRDIFVPFKEMLKPMKKDEYHIVSLVLDEKSNRLMATAKVQNQLKAAQEEEFERNQEATGLVYEETEIGYKVIVDHQYQGMLYKNQVFEQVSAGDELNVYIQEVREDGKLDLALQLTGYGGINTQAEEILNKLERAEGFLPYHDKSDAQIIQAEFGMSKKNFKKAIGMLYKQKKIIIEPKGIRKV